MQKPVNTCPGYDNQDRMNGHISRRVEQLERVLVENGIDVPEPEIVEDRPALRAVSGGQR